MPKFVKTERDEHLWEKAKEIVKKQYGKTEEDGDEFWALVTGVYKKAGGHIGKALFFDASALDIINEPSEEPLEKAHKDLPPGGVWRTIRGRHVYIVDGEIVAGNIPGITSIVSEKKATKKTSSKKASSKKASEEKETKKTTKKTTTKKAATKKTLTKKATTKKTAAKKETEAVLQVSEVAAAPAHWEEQANTKIRNAKTQQKAPTITEDWDEYGRVKIRLERVGSYPVHGKEIHSYQDLATMFADLADEDREKLYVVATKGNKVVGTQCVHIGTLDASIAMPRDILKLPTLSDADGFYVLHNHPSGESNPSDNDFDVTRKLNEAAKRAGFKFHGHVVIGDGNFHAIDPETGLMTLGNIPEKHGKKTNIPLYETKQEKRKDVHTVQIRTPDDVARYALDHLKIRDSMYAVMLIGLDTKNRTVSATHLDVQALFPYMEKKDIALQEVSRALLKSNAASFIIATGSGLATHRIDRIGFREMGDILGIRLLDVLEYDTDDKMVSYKAQGRLDRIKSIMVQKPAEGWTEDVIIKSLATVRDMLLGWKSGV